MQVPDSAREFMERQTGRLRGLSRKVRIVFGEGDDPRVREAATRLEKENLAEPILIGKQGIDPEHSLKVNDYARLLHERRRSRGMTEMEARQLARNPLYFAGLMVQAGDADGFIAGAATTTAETFRAAVSTVGVRNDVQTVSGVMIICTHAKELGAGGIFCMADPALVIDPSSSQLADIAIATAETTRTVLGVEPTVALLSFSTKGSAKHPWVAKVVEARRIVEARSPQLHVDGELQADAAIVPAVGRSKAPGSTVAGSANTLIFPDVASANIGVKLVERLGGSVNLGPFFQGLTKPANDLPRGCSGDDIYRVAIVTALQAGL